MKAKSFLLFTKTGHPVYRLRWNHYTLDRIHLGRTLRQPESYHADEGDYRLRAAATAALNIGEPCEWREGPEVEYISAL